MCADTELSMRIGLRRAFHAETSEDKIISHIGMAQYLSPNNREIISAFAKMRFKNKINT